MYGIHAQHYVNITGRAIVHLGFEKIMYGGMIHYFPADRKELYDKLRIVLDELLRHIHEN
jgi:hypothetical protein